MENNNEELELDLKEILFLLKQKIWIVLGSGIFVAILVGIVTAFFITPIYTSTTKLYIVGKSTALTSLADLQLGTQLTQDYMVLVKSRPVVDKVISNLELEATYEAVSDMVSLSNPADTRILVITVNHPDPYMAKEIVDEFAKVSTAQIAAIMEVDKPTIVEKGHMESFPSSPNMQKNVLIGGILGLLLAAFFVVVRYVLDDTIQSSEDIERYLGLNTLGLIPLESSGIKETKREKSMKSKKGKR